MRSRLRLSRRRLEDDASEASLDASRPIFSRILGRRRDTEATILLLPAPPPTRHYVASQRSFRHDIATAHAQLDASRTKRLPKWALLFMDNDALNSTKTRGRSKLVHYLHVLHAYCTCVQCIAEDAYADVASGDELPQSLAEALAEGAIDFENELTQQMLALPSPPTDVETPSEVDDEAQKDGRAEDALLKLESPTTPKEPVPDATCVQGNCCVLRTEDTRYRARLERVPLPRARALEALCGSSAPAEFELGVVRRSVAEFTGLAAKLSTRWHLYFIGAPRSAILTAAAALAAGERGSQRAFAIQGTLHRFAVDAGVHFGGVAYRRQTVVVVQGILVVRAGLGAIRRSEFPLTLGFGEDKTGAASVADDGELGEVSERRDAVARGDTDADG